ncbi:unnamed protein product [Cylicocyclus nassatus]|uniref:Uncharacterized protein n=1 Tax=Cylicocyclus nassatus TaxID=53992 RepID=A0AA36H700_CYLNA|nr:unnamed protein product [Cylicocyclus nassatus]
MSRAETEATTTVLFSPTTSTFLPTTAPKETRRCLFVGDLLNFDRRIPDYEKEKRNISEIVDELLSSGVEAEGAIWAYGYTNEIPHPEEKLSNMTSDSEWLTDDINITMNYIDLPKPNYSNKEVIDRINNITEINGTANCLVFFTALPYKRTINLEKRFNTTEFEKIVVVRLRDSNETASDVVERILDINATESPVTITTKLPPTTVPGYVGPHCLIAGDLLNFDKRVEEYEKEREFVINIGEKLLGVEDAAVSIWAYGYANTSDINEALNCMTYSSTSFASDVNETMAYVEVHDPMSNKKMLETLNDNSIDWEGKANCLVLLSAMKKAKGPEKLIPNKSIRRTVVVSLRGADLKDLVDLEEDPTVKVNATNGYTKENVEEVVEKIRRNIWELH